LQARVHVVFEDADNIAQKMVRLNKAVSSNCPDNRFITFFLSVVNPETGEIVYSNAGHNPPLVVRATGGYETLSGGGMILGILPMAKYEQFTAKLEHGDILVLFSDGVTEAADPQDREFGEDRLAELVAKLRNRPAREIIDQVHEAVIAYTEGAPAADDITLVVVRRT
jgi:sigma-B regulation protein RsbU (phosphoserine phosphatase)